MGVAELHNIEHAKGRTIGDDTVHIKSAALQRVCDPNVHSWTVIAHLAEGDAVGQAALSRSSAPTGHHDLGAWT
jgi:hypothetical protein